MAKNYRELTVWQKAMDLVAEVYKIIKMLPGYEQYALSDQMRRAAISIPSNIAEGQARKTTKEFVNFLSVARGSNAELNTQCLICQRLAYVSEKDLQPTLNLSDEVGKMLSSLIIQLSTNH